MGSNGNYTGTSPNGYSNRPNGNIRIIVVIAIIIAIFFIAKDITENLANKNYPPVSCQLLGGQWTIYNGWKCGETLQQTQHINGAR